MNKWLQERTRDTPTKGFLWFTVSQPVWSRQSGEALFRAKVDGCVPQTRRALSLSHTVSHTQIHALSLSLSLSHTHFLSLSLWMPA
jgi:hypothetical protein